MPQRLLIIALCLLGLFACKSRKPDSVKNHYKHKLIVYCTDTFRKSGLESTVVPEFTAKNDCRIELVMFRNAKELSQAIKDPANYGTYDLAIGVDNCFAMSESLFVHFVPPENFNPGQLTKEAIIDTQYRLIPYAYSNMSLIVNTGAIGNPPTSFGELQDAKYLSQVAICDPHESGVGRATLFWSLALFGTDGYEHLWKSLRKNIYKSYADRGEALAALQNGECNLLLSLNTIPAYLQELDPQNNKFTVSMLKEGSYLYVESIGIHRGTSQSVLAAKLVKHFLAPEPQKMVIYKLGMLPANRKTLLPMHFSNIPFNTYNVNSHIDQALISEQLNVWLDFWDRLFGFQIS